MSGNDTGKAQKLSLNSETVTDIIVKSGKSSCSATWDPAESFHSCRMPNLVSSLQKRVMRRKKRKDILCSMEV